jgi:IS30 family transposase
VLGCSQSTTRARTPKKPKRSGVYLPDTAQAKSEERRQNSKHPFANVTETIIDDIKKGLKDYHSPEQIAGRLKREGKESISHETIYKMI